MTLIRLPAHGSGPHNSHVMWPVLIHGSKNVLILPHVMSGKSQAEFHERLSESVNRIAEDYQMTGNRAKLINRILPITMGHIT